jgi:hypothetical protein
MMELIKNRKEFRPDAYPAGIMLLALLLAALAGSLAWSLWSRRTGWIVENSNGYGGHTFSQEYRRDDRFKGMCTEILDLYDSLGTLKETRIFLTAEYALKTGCRLIIDRYGLPQSLRGSAVIEHYYTDRFAEKNGYWKKVNYVDAENSKMVILFYGRYGKSVKVGE